MVTVANTHLVQTAGDIRVEVVKDALKAGADILVVGRGITTSKDIEYATDEFLDQLNREEIDQFRVQYFSIFKLNEQPPKIRISQIWNRKYPFLTATPHPRATRGG